MAAATDSPPPVQTLWRLNNIPEARVVKAGMQQLYRVMVVECNADVLILPRRPNGSSLLAASFITRLLNKEVELKGCQGSDVSNAQPDLKHLRVEQLLALRAPTLDFAVGSRHAAHTSYLETLDSHIFEKLGQHCLQDADKDSKTRTAYRFVGHRLIVTAGAVQVLRDGWDDQSPRALAGRGEVPLCWAFELKHEEWPEHPAILVDVSKLWVEATSGQPEEMSRLLAKTSDGRVAVIADGTTVAGHDRVLHWDVGILPPGRDLVTELQRADRAREPVVQQKRLKLELLKVLEARNKASPEKEHLPQPQLSEESSPQLSERSKTMPAQLLGEHHGGKYSGVLSSARDRQNQPLRVAALNRFASTGQGVNSPRNGQAAEAPAEAEDLSLEAVQPQQQPEVHRESLSSADDGSIPDGLPDVQVPRAAGIIADSKASREPAKEEAGPILRGRSTSAATTADTSSAGTEPAHQRPIETTIGGERKSQARVPAHEPPSWLPWDWFVGSSQPDTNAKEAARTQYKRGGCCGVGPGDICGETEDILVEEPPAFVQQRRYDSFMEGVK